MDFQNLKSLALIGMTASLTAGTYVTGSVREEPISLIETAEVSQYFVSGCECGKQMIYQKLMKSERKA